MCCIEINIQSVLLILFALILNGVNQAQTGGSEINKDRNGEIDYLEENANCPSDVECSKLGWRCIKCNYNYTCLYGAPMNATCEAKVKCIGERTFLRTLLCRYCYQTEHWEHICTYGAKCSSVTSPRAYYITNCTVKSEVLCLGNHTFEKNVLCNWTGGYRWSTALLLSITLGGFGADRFYLGHWQEGIGKLFSFGGLGVWTLIDVILISLHYLGPADGSLYI